MGKFEESCTQPKIDYKLAKISLFSDQFLEAKNSNSIVLNITSNPPI